MRDVAERIADQGGLAERGQLVTEDGLEGEIGTALLVGDIPAEGANNEAGRSLQEPGAGELRQVALDPGRRLIDILEAEDAVREIDLLRRAEGRGDEGQRATDQDSLGAAAHQRPRLR